MRAYVELANVAFGHLGEGRIDSESILADTQARQDFQSAVDQALSTMKERERVYLRWRFGLDGEKPLTQEEIAAQLPKAHGGIGLTKGGISQFGNKTIRKFRHPSHSSYFRPFFPESE